MDALTLHKCNDDIVSAVPNHQSNPLQNVLHFDSIMSTCQQANGLNHQEKRIDQSSTIILRYGDTVILQSLRTGTTTVPLIIRSLGKINMTDRPVQSFQKLVFEIPGSNPLAHFCKSETSNVIECRVTGEIGRNESRLAWQLVNTAWTSVSFYSSQMFGVSPLFHSDLGIPIVERLEQKDGKILLTGFCLDVVQSVFCGNRQAFCVSVVDSGQLEFVMSSLDKVGLSVPLLLVRTDGILFRTEEYVEI